MARLTKEARCEMRQEIADGIVYPSAEDILAALDDLDAADEDIAILRTSVETFESIRGREMMVAQGTIDRLTQENERLHKAVQRFVGLHSEED